MKIGFQGISGAYSEQACKLRFPQLLPQAFVSFEDVFAAVEHQEVALGMIPVENSVAGAINDNYDLLASYDLFIIGEYYLPVQHCLLALPQTQLEGLRLIYSHPQALAQCRRFIQRHQFPTQAVFDTAGAAQLIQQQQLPHQGAIAPQWCADLFQLVILAENIQSTVNNTTRFLVIAKNANTALSVDEPSKTSLIFTTQNIPAALYKCLGGLATHGINLTSLQSRPIPEANWCYRFYLDFFGHPDQSHVQQAITELEFYAQTVKILGSYPAHL